MDIVERSQDIQDGISERVKRVGKGKYGRVIKMARKPTDEEFAKTATIVAIGVILIGGMGFAIYLIMKYGPTMFG
jgi:protein transport protein SEC61 subunit gamma-like protein